MILNNFSVKHIFYKIISFITVIYTIEVRVPLNIKFKKVNSFRGKLQFTTTHHNINLIEFFLF